MAFKTVKDIQKSVQLTLDIYEYIDNYRGENFSVKLSNLVYDAMKGEAKRVIAKERKPSGKSPPDYCRAAPAV